MFRKGERMKRYLERWDGKIIINGKECSDLSLWNPKKGEKFDIVLVPVEMLGDKVEKDNG